MSWGTRLFAVVIMLASFALGAWPLGLFALLYLVYTLRRPGAKSVQGQRQEVFQKTERPWRRYALGAVLFLLSSVAAGSGGTYSPAVFFATGLAVFFWPTFGRLGHFARVVTVKDSILLRSSLSPVTWHALAEVKLESPEQARGIAAMGGKLLLFSGKTPAVFQVVSVRALSYRHAEESVLRKLRRETRMLSQRGAHLLPVDSSEAAVRLSLELERLSIDANDFEAVSSLPFDAIAFQVKDGRLVSHRAFSVLERDGVAAIPVADLRHAREPLFAEVVQEIGEKHGWPGPDEYSPFLASLDASRSEPLVDRLRMKEEVEGRVTVETPGGAQVRLTRAQVRALARIYA
jgi:hypothetical protein